MYAANLCPKINLPNMNQNQTVILWKEIFYCAQFYFKNYTGGVWEVCEIFRDEKLIEGFYVTPHGLCFLGEPPVLVSISALKTEVRLDVEMAGIIITGLAIKGCLDKDKDFLNCSEREDFLSIYYTLFDFVECSGFFESKDVELFNAVLS
jgi:hypothetical protein